MKMNIIRVISVVLIGELMGRIVKAESKLNILLHWSQAALIVGNSFDAESSYGKQERNLLLKDGTG